MEHHNANIIYRDYSDLQHASLRAGLGVSVVQGRLCSVGSTFPALTLAGRVVALNHVVIWCRRTVCRQDKTSKICEAVDVSVG